MRFEYPYTNFHEMNLDWIIEQVKKLGIQFDEFKVINQITFSGAWDITKQYPAWTIVSDNNIGYISIVPVPAGVTLDNGDYWREVIDYTAQIAGLQQRVVDLENDMTTAITNIDLLLTKTEHVKNVKNYGAIGDGITDDTNAIQLAIDDCIDGDLLLFPAGTYIISNGFIIDKPINILGGNSTTITTATTIDRVFYFQAVDGVTLANIKIDCKGTTSANNLSCILFYLCNNCFIDKVRLYNTAGIGFEISNCANMTMTNSSVDTTFNHKMGIWCGHDSDAPSKDAYNYICNCRVENAQLDGLLLDYELGDTIKDCVFNNNGTNPDPLSGALGACGIYVNSNCTFLTITNCECNENSECGIDVETSISTKIDNCSCWTNGLSGIYFGNNNYLATIINNICCNNGKDPTLLNPDHWFKAGIGLGKMFKFNVCNNFCADTDPNTQSYGIQYGNVLGTHTESIITGNNLVGNVTAGDNYTDITTSDCMHTNNNGVA